MPKLKGVNLGGWLVKEKWIGDISLTESDFQWIKNQGLNAIRIPVPYNFQVDLLDFAFAQAEKNNLKVIIDLHMAPGNQNGWDHGGIEGMFAWHTNQENISLTLIILEDLVKRYSTSPALFGIELLNEPHWDIPINILKKFYHDGYQIVRKHCREEIAVIIHDSFRPFEWSKDFQKDRYPNLILDTHLYQCFTDSDCQMNIDGHLEKTKNEWDKQIAKQQQSLPVIIGEWSLGLDPLSLKDFFGNTLSEQEQQQAFKDYANAQLEVFEQALGWFFWTYKTQDMPEWNLHHLITSGIIKL